MILDAAVLFDLDGTLTDSAPGILRSTREAMAALNREDGVSRAIPAESELRWIVGPPLLTSFIKLVGPDDAERMLKLYRARYEAAGMFECALYDGVVESLEQLTATGRRLYVATSKVQSYAERVIAHFGLNQFFSAVYGSRPDGSHAEKAEILTSLIAHEGLTAPRTVMIGDRQFDAAGARAVGVAAIGALWGYGDTDELREAGADPIVASPREIPDAVTKVLARQNGVNV